MNRVIIANANFNFARALLFRPFGLDVPAQREIWAPPKPEAPDEFAADVHALAAAAHRYGCRPALWRRLGKAARVWDIYDCADEYEARFHEALARSAGQAPTPPNDR